MFWSHVNHSLRIGHVRDEDATGGKGGPRGVKKCQIEFETHFHFTDDGRLGDVGFETPPSRSMAAVAHNFHIRRHLGVIRMEVEVIRSPASVNIPYSVKSQKKGR